MTAQRECETIALRLLANREHSRYELQQKLQQRCTCEAKVIAPLLDKLQEMGYLDDARYAAVFIRSGVARGRGKQRIVYELHQQGISDTLIAQALAAADVDWFALAREQREKKFGREIPVDYKERARQARFLAGRGFATDSIQAAFNHDPDE